MEVETRSSGGKASAPVYLRRSSLLLLSSRPTPRPRNVKQSPLRYPLGPSSTPSIRQLGSTPLPPPHHTRFRPFTVPQSPSRLLAHPIISRSTLHPPSNIFRQTTRRSNHKAVARPLDPKHPTTTPQFRPLHEDTLGMRQAVARWLR